MKQGRKPRTSYEIIQDVFDAFEEGYSYSLAQLGRRSNTHPPARMKRAIALLEKLSIVKQGQFPGRSNTQRYYVGETPETRWYDT